MITELLSNIKRRLHKTLSEGRGMQLFWLVAITFIVIILFCTIATLVYKDVTWQDTLALFLDPGGFDQKAANHHDGFNLVATLFGMFLFSALLISVVSNIFENIAESFRKGYSRYRHSGHVLILGAGRPLHGILSALMQEAKKDGSPFKGCQVVVLADTDIDALRSRLLSSFDGPERKFVQKRIMLYHGERDNADILTEKDLARNAAFIYIIGEDGESDHDSVSVRSCEKLKEIFEGVPDACHLYLVLEDPASLDIYEYSTDKETRKGSGLKVDVIYANEHTVQQVLIPRHERKDEFPVIDYRPVEEDGVFRYRTDHAGITADCDNYVHLVVAGTTDMALAMAQTAAHFCHFPNFRDGRNRTVISFVDRGIKEKMSRFVSAYDNLFRLSHYRYVSFDAAGVPAVTRFTPEEKFGDFLDVEWEFVDADICSAEVSALLRQAAGDSRQALSLAICLETRKENTFAATHLPYEIYRKGCPVFVHQLDGHILNKAVESGQFGNLHPFGGSEDPLSDPLFRHRAENGMRVNFVYDQNQVSKEYQHENMEDAWYDLSEAHKLSSIYCAIALPARARSFGLTEDFDIDRLDEDARESLYEVEHRRWVMSNLLLGYRPFGKDERVDWNRRMESPDRKVREDAMKERRRWQKGSYFHYCISPHSELNREDRDRDKDMMDPLIKPENRTDILG